MIPLSVLSIFKWLIFPFWQRLAGACCAAPFISFLALYRPSSGREPPVVTGHVIPDHNRFYKAVSADEMTHLEPLGIDQYLILKGIRGCNRPIFFNSQQITLAKLVNNDISFSWQLGGEMGFHTTSINACKLSLFARILFFFFAI